MNAPGGVGGQIASITDPEEQKAVAEFGPQQGPYVAALRRAMKAAHMANDQAMVRTLATKLQMVVQQARQNMPNPMTAVPMASPNQLPS